MSDMARVPTTILIFLVATGALAADPPQSASVLIPVVGSVIGINNVRWKTDIDLFNDTRS